MRLRQRVEVVTAIYGVVVLVIVMSACLASFMSWAVQSPPAMPISQRPPRAALTARPPR